MEDYVGTGSYPMKFEAPTQICILDTRSFHNPMNNTKCIFSSKWQCYIVGIQSSKDFILNLVLPTILIQEYGPIIFGRHFVVQILIKQL